MVSSAQLSIVTSDNVELGATHYFTDHKPDGIKSAAPLIIVAGATGTPQRFYKRFAEAAVNAGCQVLTFDYRGIGRSRPQTLKGYQVDYLDWAKQDLAAVIAHCKIYDAPIYIVGHSYGGHAVGLLPDLSPIRGVWTFGTGAGWSGWMPTFERIKVQFMWHIVAPVLTRVYGYLGWSRLGMGEDLPLNVYRQWKHWCSYPNYFFGDPELPELPKQFARVKIPVTAINATDDKWAPPVSRDAFMQHYSNANLSLQTVTPNSVGQGIGHMGYFRSHCESLWHEVFAAITPKTASQQ
ncbi:alpha/beta hydrolase family protein [Planctobacterium marinum]|uniref:AB hydrolase-1 domain-containing protein n=1 Tax=Planctobacterium marinum TaxID=1631968 RepID=A0AA48HWL3_9ALTE|nr:hypothetical protein MACH26_14410 [Planctobacterium marinum]